MKKNSLLIKTLFFINSLLAVVTACAYLIPYIPPRWFPKLSVLTFILPLLVGLHILFAICWLLRLKRHAFLSILILILGIGQIKNMYTFGKTTPSTVGETELKIMSYNVQSFNDKNWIAGEGLGDKIIDFIMQEAPDVVCIQEHHDTYSLSKSVYPYQFKEITNTKLQFGHMIYSKYPIVDQESFNFEESGNNILYVDIKVAQDTLRIYNVHLQSFGVPSDIEGIQQNSERFLRRIGNAVKKQEVQVAQFVEHEAQSPYPVLLGGDFNNSPFSYIYRKMKGEKQDAFAKAGSGMGNTFKFDIIPLRIDFIFADAKFEVKEFTNYDVEYSDHYPISSTLIIKPD